MATFFKWLAISLAGILLLLVIGVIALPFIFPLEKIKDFAVTKLSETIHRQVKIEKVSFDIFSGIKLEGLSVGNRAGFSQSPFIRGKAIELRYAFWPLFSRQIIIKEVRLVNPEILIEKNARGEFNFSDLLQSKPSNHPTIQPSNNPPAKPPFDLFVSSFSLTGGKLLYQDNQSKTTNEIRNINVSLAGFELALIKPVDFKAAADIVYKGQVIPVSLTSRIGINLAKETIELSPINFSLAGESASASASIAGWKLAPSVNFSLRSKKLSLDPLLAVFAASSGAKAPTPKPGELTRSVDQMTASVPKNISVRGQINIENLTFQKFVLDKADLILALARKTVTLDIKEMRLYEGLLSGKAKVDLAPSGLNYAIDGLKLTDFNSTPFTNALVETFLTGLTDHKDLLNKVYGKLSASLSLKGRGVEPQAILANAVGQGSFDITGGELKRLKTLAEVGKLIKSNSLQNDLPFGLLSGAFSIDKRVVGARNLKLDSSTIKVNFTGGADLAKLTWVAGNRLTLKLSPAVSKDTPGEFSLFRDDQGWLEMTFEISGSLTKPLPKPILEKPLEKAVGKIKLKVEAKKIEIERAVDAAKASAEAEIKAKLKEEAKSRLKDLFKP